MAWNFWRCTVAVCLRGLALTFSAPPASSAPNAQFVGQVSIIDGDTVRHARSADSAIRNRRSRISADLCRERAEVQVRSKCRVRAGGLHRQENGHLRPARRRSVNVDRYRRIVAVCMVGAEDIGAWMVLSGWALAYRRYSSDYVDEENVARKELGIPNQDEFP